MQQALFATRLTLYAIISSIELDLRSVILNYIISQQGTTSIFPPDLRARLVERRAKSEGATSQCGSDEQLIEYIDFADSYVTISTHDKLLPNEIIEAYNRIAPTLPTLVPIRNRVMHSRPLEPDDFPTTYDTAKTLVKDKGFPWHQLRSTLARLQNDPSYVLTLTLPELPWETEAALPHNMPLPDFDDTGFIGRKKDRDDLSKLILGHHQIITITGEGGTGKTATLLKCLYDLLDSIQGKFDTVVWVSLKNQILTAGGILELRDSVTTTLGLYEAIAKPLGASRRTGLTETLNELLEYLNEFKVLLAIDNLETLQHAEIMDFLRDLPPSTKLVITSRIGLGDLEFRRPLLPMTDSEAALLLRRFAQAHVVNSLAKLPQEDAVAICKKLHFNPLAIRWFVSSVQRGASPNSVLQHQQNLLEYCVQNVYDKLTESARALLQTLLASRRSLGEAELAFLMDMGAIEVRRYIYEIVSTMMIRMEQTKLSDGSFETQYSLTELARGFMDMHHKPGRRQMEQISKKLVILSSSAEAAGLYRNTKPYDQRAIMVRSSNDHVPAYLLQHALEESARGRFGEAFAHIQKAKDLAPTYSEVYKVSAFVKAATDDFVGAEQDYEQALDLSPNSSQILYAYAGFRGFRLQDSKGAYDLILRAEAIDGANKDIKAYKARFLTYLGKYDEAWKTFSEIMGSMERAPNVFRQKTTDMALNCLHRWMEYLNGLRDYRGSIAVGKTALEIVDEAVDEWPHDGTFGHRLHDLLLDLAAAAHRSNDTEMAEIISRKIVQYDDLLSRDRYFASLLAVVSRLFEGVNIDKSRLRQLVELAAKYGIDLKARRHTGSISFVNPEQRFGRIISDVDQREYYFNFSDVARNINSQELRPGCRLAFGLGKNSQGTCASNLGNCD